VDAGIDDVEGCDVLQMDTLLRYNLYLDPDTLSDEQWAWTIEYLCEIKKLFEKTNELSSLKGKRVHCSTMNFMEKKIIIL
jgi:hypothetical protein